MYVFICLLVQMRGPVGLPVPRGGNLIYGRNGGFEGGYPYSRVVDSK